MGSDDLFKKRREERKRRKREFKDPKPNSFLIVTEGECTEPLYFTGMANRIKKKLGGNIDVREIPTIDIKGKGCSTNSLIRKTEEIISKAKIMYENVWVVFDKDDFDDFDEAILRAKKNGYEVAWSNQSFEYWLFLHFSYNDSGLHRDDWFHKLNDKFKENQIGNGEYKKNEEDIFEIVTANNGLDNAISNAKRRMCNFDETIQKPSQYDPGTMVYKLAEKLNTYLKDS